MITRIDKFLAVVMAHEIVSDGRNEAKYGEITFINPKTRERFAYTDMLNTLGEMRTELGMPNGPLQWEDLSMHRLVWMEIRHLDKPIPAIFRQTMDDQAWYMAESGYVFTFDMDGLGKRWRAWAQEPTDEERSAAEWM